jgi:hypothetical protein
MLQHYVQAHIDIQGSMGQAKICTLLYVLNNVNLSLLHSRMCVCVCHSSY